MFEDGRWNEEWTDEGMVETIVDVAVVMTRSRKSTFPELSHFLARCSFARSCMIMDTIHDQKNSISKLSFFQHPKKERVGVNSTVRMLRWTWWDLCVGRLFVPTVKRPLSPALNGNTYSVIPFQTFYSLHFKVSNPRTSIHSILPPSSKSK